MDYELLTQTASSMVAPDRGILAIDESTPTCGKRLQSVGVENTEANRITYRNLLLGTPGLADYISSAILYDETIRQSNSDGITFPDLMQQQNIIIGIKVDTGAKEFALHPGEKVTEGLDGLRDRLEEYKTFGARFCKWRAVIAIDNEKGLPSRGCIEANAHALARYAALCQEAGMVPIVEPEVLLDGNHSIDTCYQVTVEVQRTVFEQLYRQNILFEGIVLKPSMVLAGKEHERQASVQQVAEQTIQCLQQTVPAAVPGIAFLSGGQTDEQATQHLNSMNQLARDMDLPWRLTFSYARALQHPALTTWKGDPGKIDTARKALLHRARLNSLASKGEYTDQMEQQQAA